ncbi:hypothetical protein RHSIM_Rhsim05G0114000 [Rhododendron simsii]|uniref:Uncharacterized protein n=1 Tax=Rhododendron simsii TaxID=118357 RepID=A0A834GV99_RHOSS|nr:hypothetical protein RHSIM_Rhsim05G0114000 [Rhododendron simsii]
MTSKGKPTHVGNGEKDSRSRVSPFDVSSIFILKRKIVSQLAKQHSNFFYVYFRNNPVKRFQKEHLCNVLDENENEFLSKALQGDRNNTLRFNLSKMEILKPKSAMGETTLLSMFTRRYKEFGQWLGKGRQRMQGVERKTLMYHTLTRLLPFT